MADPQDLVTVTARHVRETMSLDAAHDWWHIRRVWQLALRIGQAEGADLHIVQLAALLHDIADWKFAGGDETAGPRLATQFLQSQQAPPATVDHVARIIATLSFKGAGVPTPMDSIEGQVVQDADRLDAIGAIGVARAFAYGGHKGQPLHSPDAPPQWHASFADYKQGAAGTINHFHEKLLLLRDRMNTATARNIAEARHAFLERFVQQFMAEWNGAG